MHDPTKFPNIYFNKTKAQHNFCLFRFKVSIHKIFHQHTSPLKIFESYIIVQYYFQQVTKVCLQVTQVLVSNVSNVFDAFVQTTILTLQTKPSLPSRMAITLSIGHLFLLVSSHNKTMSPTLKFLTILFHL